MRAYKSWYVATANCANPSGGYACASTCCRADPCLTKVPMLCLLCQRITSTMLGLQIASPLLTHSALTTQFTPSSHGTAVTPVGMLDMFPCNCWTLISANIPSCIKINTVCRAVSSACHPLAYTCALPTSMHLRAPTTGPKRDVKYAYLHDTAPCTSVALLTGAQPFM